MKTAFTREQTVVGEIRQFLRCATPESWLLEAVRQLPLLLLDHANCEKKAASTALNLMYRYVDNFTLLHRMSRLAREELRHFEQVLAIMERRGIAYQQITASRYAGGLRALIRTQEPGRMVDTLVVGAFIEARSCERFARLAPRLPERLAGFYRGLLASESRHFEHYLEFARIEAGASQADLDARLAELKELEAQLITDPDPQFRFHSGSPAAL